MLNISTNISALGRRTHLKLGEPSSLFIVYNITIFWLCPLHSFLFYFLLRDSAHTLYNEVDHKDCNFLDCDWFRNVLFFTNLLAKLLSDTLLSISQSNSKFKSTIFIYFNATVNWLLIMLLVFNYSFSYSLYIILKFVNIITWIVVDILKFVGPHQLFSCLLVLTYMTNKICMYVPITFKAVVTCARVRARACVCFFGA